MTTKKTSDAPLVAPVRPMGDRGQGRKAYAPEDKRKPRTVNLTDAQWEKLKILGTDWLIERLKRAKVAS